MGEVFLLRRVLRSPATSTAVLLDQKFFHATTTTSSATIKEENQKFKEKEAGKKSNKGKWVTLPPFNTTIDSNTLGKRLIGKGNEPIESTTTAIKWVLRCCPHLPRSLVQKLFRLRQVRRECFKGDSGHDAGSQECQLKRVGAKDLITKGDRILLPITVKESHANKHECQCSKEELSYIRSLELYKDSAIIAINKPPKLPVQSGHGIKKSLDELAAACLRYESNDLPRLVHRLDRDSSGILVMGRTQTSTALLHSIFREKTVGMLDDKEINWGKRTLQKRYLALVFGVPRRLKGLISAPLAKVVLDDGKSERITVADRSSSSQHAVTEYRVIETSTCGYTWLELLPLTGRKHQLRVHCAEVLGTPIVGDYKYGWHAHRKWEPLPSMRSCRDKKLSEEKPNALGLNLECGSIAEKQPHLHLHCKQMILPNISMALQHASSPDSDYDFSKLEPLNLVAPLPSHMQRSWSLLYALAKQAHCE